jgi:hypothetical protein
MAEPPEVGADEPEGPTQERQGLTADEPEKPEGERQGLIEWVSKNPVVVVTLIGAFAYLITRIAQTSFYNKFGVDPEDVGLSYSATLSRAALGLIVVLLAALVLTTFTTFVGPKVAVEEPPDAEAGRRRIGPSASVLLASFTVALVLLAIWWPLVYSYDATDVLHGKRLRPTLLGIYRNPLGLRAEVVHVAWIDPTHARYKFFVKSKPKRVVYLGSAGGIAVFFDPTNQQTVRVPQNDIVIGRTRLSNGSSY